jgi:hypothetical protein
MKVKCTIRGDGYTHRLSKAKRHGADLGDCEICRTPMSDAYILATFRPYYNPIRKVIGLSQVEAKVFGHRECCSQNTDSKVYQAESLPQRKEI